MQVTKGKVGGFCMESSAPLLLFPTWQPGFGQADDTSVLCIQTLMTRETTPQKGVAHKLPMSFILLELLIFLFASFFALLYGKYR